MSAAAPMAPPSRAADRSAGDPAGPSPGAVARVVRSALGLPDDSPLDVSEVTEHTNINFVYRVKGEALALFVKAATVKLKAFELEAPRERVIQEAERAKQFRELCGGFVDVPRVMFLDRESFMVGLEDVGEGRRVMIDTLDSDYGACAKDAIAWGRCLGTLGRDSRVRGSVASESVSPGMAVWYAIMAAGSFRVFPEAVETVLRPLCERQECLVHTDLWGKNILVHPAGRPALLDFENAGIGDPAVDVSALLTALLIPALVDAGSASKSAAYATFVKEFERAYLGAIEDGEWGRQVLLRSYRAVSVNLAHRAVGMAPYAMPEEGRNRAVAVAARLFRSPPQDVDAFIQTATR
jgi:hypothetical protein